MIFEITDGAVKGASGSNHKITVLRLKLNGLKQTFIEFFS